MPGSGWINACPALVELSVPSSGWINACPALVELTRAQLWLNTRKCCHQETTVFNIKMSIVSPVLSVYSYLLFHRFPTLQGWIYIHSRFYSIPTIQYSKCIAAFLQMYNLSPYFCLFVRAVQLYKCTIVRRLNDINHRINWQKLLGVSIVDVIPDINFCICHAKDTNTAQSC